MTRRHMTAHYARLSDKTVREHWEKARKVNAAGQPVRISPDGPLGEAAWAKQQLSRATQALPERLLPAPGGQDLPACQSCLTCPMFVTTAGVPPPASRPAAGHAADHHRRRGERAHPRRRDEQGRSPPTWTRSSPPSRPSGQPPGRRRAAECALTRSPTAAARRHELTRARAIQALRELDRAGPPVTFACVARQRASPGRGSIPSPTSATRSAGSAARANRRPAGPIPAGQRATDASLRARLTTALDRNQQLADENARLRRQLARALGDQRSARPRSGNDPAP